MKVDIYHKSEIIKTIDCDLIRNEENGRITLFKTEECTHKLIASVPIDYLVVKRNGEINFKLHGQELSKIIIENNSL